MKTNPYVGPRPYERGDQPKFFGRNREARDLLALTLAQRLVLLYAQSGAGKTSLLNAHIIPALGKEGFSVLPVARVGGNAPPGIGPASIGNVFVFSALMGLAEADTPAQGLLPHTLRSFLEQRCQAGEDSQDLWWSAGERRPVVAIFDQFEEIFTTHQDRWQDARGFFVQLAEALDALPGLSVVLAMREDHVAELDPYAALFPNRLRARFRMERLGPEGALEAITKPAASAGVPFAPGVAERLVDDLRRIKAQSPPTSPPSLQGTATPEGGRIEGGLGPYIEPVQLQVVCQQLWDRLPEQEDRLIQWDDVERYGDIDQALTGFYDSVLFQTVQVTGAGERKLRHWFGEQLITPMKTRGLALREAAETAGLANAAVDFLETRHIIRADVRAGARWYELVHDRLIDPIRYSNRDWEAARQTPLRTAAMRWQETRNASLLYRDKALAEALAWIAASPEEAEPQEREFVEASQQAEARRTRMRQAYIAGSIAALLVIILVSAMTWVALRSSLLAYSRQMAAASIYTLNLNRRQSVQAAREGVVTQHADWLARSFRPLMGPIDTTDAQIALRLGLVDFYPAEVFEGLNDQVMAVTYSADGRFLYAGFPSGGVRVWDMQSADEQARLPDGGAQGTGPVWGLDYSPDLVAGALGGAYLAAGGAYLAAGGASGGGVVGMWNVEAGRWAQQLRVAMPKGMADTIYAVAYSPALLEGGAAGLATGGDYDYANGKQGLVRLWALSPASGGGLAAQAVLTLTEPAAHVGSVDFSREGRYLAAASDDKTVRIWAIQPASDKSMLAAPVVTLTDHTDAVKAVAFSPGEDLMASGSSDRTIRIWDTNTWRAILTLVGHTAGVTSLAFSPDGRYLVSGSRDRTVRVWDIESRNPTAIVLTGPDSLVNAVSVSPDGLFIAAGAGDRTLRVWDRDAPRRARVSTLSGHTARVRGVAFSPNGEFLVSSDDSTARFWSTESGAMLFSLPPFSKIWDVTYSPDGQSLVTCSEDGKLRVWDASTGLLEKELAAHTNDVNIAVFSPDGKWMATGSDDWSTIVWNTRTWEPAVRFTPTGKPGQVYAAAYSPDGQYIATGHVDNNVRLWQVLPQPGDTLMVSLAMTLTGHTDDIYSLAFSPDGKYLASGSWDSTLRLWARGVNTYTLVGEALEHPGYVYSVAFSPDGRYLASGARDGQVRLWDLAGVPSGPPRLIGILAGHTDLIWQVAFSPDGRYLASGSWDGTVRRYLVRFEDVLNLSRQYVPGDLPPGTSFSLSGQGP